MQIAAQEINNTILLVTPDGNPIPHKDCEDWSLHILPQLYTHAGANVKLIRAELTIRTEHSKPFNWPSFTRYDVLPPDVTVRCPYESSRYYVAGTCDRKMGWEYPLQPNQTWAELKLRWLVAIEAKSWNTEHRITFHLTPTQQGHIYSMQSANYSFGKNARAIALFDEISDTEFFTKGDQSYKIRRYHSPDGVNNVKITQTLNLLSHAWSDVPKVQATEETTLLRDVKPVKVFTTYQEAHQSSACVEMPAGILYRAIVNAQSLAKPEIESYWKSDAVSVITDWWNRNAPTPEYRRAGGFDLWCRVADDDQYWNAWYENPNVDVAFIKERWNPLACARWSDFIIIDFIQPPSAYVRHDDEGWLEVLSVTGSFAYDVGCDKDEELDEAYYSWLSLKNFPSMFPAAWECLKAATLDQQKTTNNSSQRVV
jgi:hypothetical protein